MMWAQAAKSELENCRSKDLIFSANDLQEKEKEGEGEKERQGEETETYRLKET